MVQIEAASAAEFLAMLGQVDISVPSRGSARLNWHRERWAAYRLLATLAGANRLAGPLTLVKRERPDFFLSAAGQEVGLEVTESTSAEYSKYASIAAEEFSNAWLEPAHFRPGAPKRSNREIRELLGEERLTAAGWSGDEMEQDWSSFLSESIKGKVEALAAPGYMLFERNWLAVYDNTPTHAVDLDRALLFLRRLIEPIWAAQPRFDDVYIEHGRTIVRLTSSSAEAIPLNDLWETGRWPR